MKKVNELRDYLLENYVDEYGDLDISGLDFSEFDGDIHVSGMKVKGTLHQDYHEVKGSLFQSEHDVKGTLFQDEHKVEGNLHQSRHEIKGSLFQKEHDVEGDYYSTSINVAGKINFEEPKKALKEITVEELEKMGYKIKKERVNAIEEKGGER